MRSVIRLAHFERCYSLDRNLRKKMGGTFYWQTGEFVTFGVRNTVCNVDDEASGRLVLIVAPRDRGKRRD